MSSPQGAPDQAPRRLAIVLSHPTQYYSPWFRYLAAQGGVALKVFYLWDFGVTSQVDKGFKTAVQWDLPLLDGYDHVFVPNVSPTPGTQCFSGLHNPGLRTSLSEFRPDAVLLFGHGWRTNAELLVRGVPGGAALLYRGDSHLLGPQGGEFKSRLRRMATRFLFRNVDQFLAVGTANSDYFTAHGAASNRITFVPHCVDNDRFQQQGSPADGERRRADLGIDSNQTVFLFAGKFEDKKRPLDVVRAFRAINHEAAVLLMVGSGTLEHELQSLASGDQRIRLLPFQNQSAMPSLYAAADVFVLPSYGRQETWGLAVNEAMNCGCASVVSDHVGCATDLVHDGENGRVIPAGNVAALEATMREALSDPHQLRNWQEKSRTIIERFSYSVARQGLLEALGKVRRPAPVQ